MGTQKLQAQQAQQGARDMGSLHVAPCTTTSTSLGLVAKHAKRGLWLYGVFASWDRCVLVLAYMLGPARPDGLLRQECELTSHAGLFLELWWKGFFP